MPRLSDMGLKKLVVLAALALLAGALAPTALSAGGSGHGAAGKSDHAMAGTFAPASRAGPSEAGPLPRKSVTPWDYMRAFHVLQDRVVRGEARILRTRRRMMAFLARLFTSFPASTWQRQLNAEALVLYLLSGGDPAAGKAVHKRTKKLPLPAGLLEGAMAFAAGRNVAASRLLRKVQTQGLSGVLRAQLLLVQASLLAGTDEAGALAMLDEVRLLRPGSLLEEVALRRAMILAGMMENAERFQHYANTYLRRFPRSVYVNDFLRRLAWLAVALDEGRKPFLIERMKEGITRLRKRQQALLYATIAREALLYGKLALSLHANAQVGRLYPDAPLLAQRLRVWRDAATVVSPEPERVVRDLLDIDADRLPAAERQLVHAALAVADAIMMEPAPPTDGQEPAGRGAEPPELAQARKMIAKVGKLLKGK